ncbi:MAG: FtsX-like permease family protein [Candidatus Asgardarchaeia archaeon]
MLLKRGFHGVNKIFLILSLILVISAFSAQVYVDSIMYMNRYDYVQMSSQDMYVRMEYEDRIPLQKTRFDKGVENVLNSSDIVVDYFDFYGMAFNFATKQIGYPGITGKLYFADNNTLQKLNIEVLEGEFNDSGVIVNIAIKDELELELGDTFRFYFTPEIFITLLVTGFFNETQENVIPINFLSTRAILVLYHSRLELVQKGYYPFEHIFIIDIDDDVVDFVNPQTTINALYELSSDIIAEGENFVSGDTIWVTVESPLLNGLYGYKMTRDSLKKTVIWSMLPIFLIFFFLTQYINEFAILKKKKEILVKVARGWNASVSLSYISSEMFYALLLGVVIGLFLSIPASKVYFLLNDGYSILEISATATIISMSTLAFLLQVIILGMTSIAAYTFILAFKQTSKSMYTREHRSLIGKIYSRFGENSFYALMMFFGLTIVYLSFSFEIVTIGTDFERWVYAIQHMIAPLAAIFSMIYFSLKLLRKSVFTRLASSARKAKSLALFLAIKNLLRSRGKLEAIIFIFAIMISTNILMASSTETYPQFALATYRWGFGGDGFVNIYSSLNKTELDSVIKDVFSLSSIKQYTAIYIYKVNIRNQISVTVYAIDPESFLKCVYDDNNKPLEDTPYANTIRSLSNLTYSLILSSSLAKWIFATENNMLNIYDPVLDQTELLAISGIISFNITYAWTHYKWFTRFENPTYYTQPLSQQRAYMKQYREAYYALMNSKHLENKNRTFMATVVYSLKDDANATKVNNLLKLKLEKYVENDKRIFSFDMLSAIKVYELLINYKNYQLEITQNYMNLSYTVLMFMLALWVYLSMVKKKRSREFGVLLAMGLKKKSITKSIIIEMLIIFFISLPYSLLLILLSAPVYAFLFDMTHSYLIMFYSSFEFLLITLATVFASLLAFTVFSFLVVLWGTKLEVSELLKIEWSEEELERCLGVSL